MTYTLFLDESGNAGINYLDTGQPFHVVGGILVAGSKIHQLEAALHNIRRPDEPELKGTKLMKSPRSQRRAAQVLRLVGEHGAMPFFTILERRFAIAGKLVDVFLDPAHQNAVDWLPTSAIQERQRITEEIFDSLDATNLLTVFAEAYRAPTVEGFTSVLQQVIIALRHASDQRIPAAFEGALRHVSSIVQLETYGDAATSHGQWAALNVPAFTHTLRYVDRLIDFKHSTFDVVHDEVLQFEEPFRRVVTWMSSPDARVADLRLPDGTLFRTAYRNLRSFRTADSKNVPVLQAADVLASSVARVARAAAQPGSILSPALTELATLTLTSLLFTDAEGNPMVSGLYAHEKTKIAILDALTKGATPR